MKKTLSTACILAFVAKFVSGNVVLTVEPQEFQDGNKCTLTCSTDTLTSDVEFQHPVGTNVGSCPVVGFTCISNSYNITQDVPRKKTILAINSYSKPRDDGDWICNYGGRHSNTLTLKGIILVKQITMNGTNPLVAHTDSKVTIMCSTSSSSPAANIVWFKDTENITSEAKTVIEDQAVETFVTRSYLTLIGNKGDSGKSIKCEGYNSPTDKVSDSTTLKILYPPPNIQTLTGYTNNDVLYVGNIVNLTCQQEGGKPFSNLSLTCNGKIGEARGSSTGSLVKLELTLDSSYNGKTCSCVSTHVVSNYRKVVSVILNVHYAPVSLPQIVDYNNGTALNDSSTVTVTCTQTGGFPLSNITWNCMGHSGNTQKSGEQSTSSVTISIDRTYNQKTCTCTATHPDPNIKYAKSESVVFTVYYAPRLPNNPTLTGYANGTALEEHSTAKRELTCRQSDCNPLCTLTWNCEGLTGTNASTETEAVSIIQVPLQRQYNGKTCKCTARHTFLAYTEHVSVYFTVHYSPSQPSISVSPTFPWLEKTRGSLHCNVADKGNPPFTSYIWLDGSGATAGQSDENLSIDVLTNLDDGRKISCGVKNSVSAAMMSEVITLNVEYSPIITVDKTNLTIIEGERAERMCTANGNPEPNVKWMKGSTIVDGGLNTSATLTIPNISRTATGVYMCHAEAVSAVASRNKLSSSQDINLIVQYPPDVHIQLSNVTEYATNVQLICVASGVPPVYTYIGWKQMIGQSTIRTEFAGLPDDGRMLTFENVTFADAGLYSCEVSNNIKYPKTATNYFDVKAAAKFKPDTKTYTFYSGLKQKLTVTIPFYSNPKALLSDIKWNNLSDNSLIKQTENTTFDVYNSLFSTSVHSVTVSLHGQSARMTISSFESFHQGNYSVTISNGLGTTSAVAFWIIPSGPPETPTNFRYVSISTTSITVQWNKGFNGGHPQTFVVLYQEDGDKKEREIKETSDTDYTLVLDQLLSENLYTLFLYSYNIEGNSKENITLTATTLKAVEEPPPSSPAAFIGGGTAGGLCLIAIIVGGIFFIKRKQTKQKDDDTILMNKRTKQAEDDDPEDGMKPNIIYESAGPDYKAPSSNVGEKYIYAEVQKDSTNNVKSNDVYAEVQKPKKKPVPEKAVYADVKGKISKGNAKEKKSKSKSKENLKKGDVYENVGAVGGILDGDVYANSAAKTENPVNNVSRRKNKDGLIYVDVVIKNDGNGKKGVIHGIENRNDYAEVDFTRHADPLPSDSEEENPPADKAEEQAI